MTGPDPDVLDAIAFPPGVDRAAVLADLYHGGWRLKGRHGAEYRRHITRHDPLAFMITYFSHYLTDQRDGSISFCPLHFRMCSRIARWCLPDNEERRAVVAPRDMAKTTYGFLCGPAWAMAHQHRRFPLAVSYTAELARGQLRNLTAELENNALLLHDFPDDVPGVNAMRIARGRGTRTGGGIVATQGGAAVGARGLGEATLGTRALQFRPDVFIGDDLEPIGGLTVERKADVLSTLLSGVLRMGRGPVLLTGTPVSYGSIMHDLARLALERPLGGSEWAVAQEFLVDLFQAITVGPDGQERALWPQRRSLQWLRARRDSDNPETRYDYSLNDACDPDPTIRADMITWTDELFRYDPRADPDFRVVTIDVSTTDGPESDSMTLAVVGYERARRRAVVEHVEEMPGGDQLPLQERLWHYKRLYPRTLCRGVIETNQGGRLWLRNMALPPDLEMREEHATENKGDRIRVLHGHYARGAVVHAQQLPALQQQMRDWGARQGRIKHDDLVDVVAAGVHEVFAGELIS